MQQPGSNRLLAIASYRPGRNLLMQYDTVLVQLYTKTLRVNSPNLLKLVQSLISKQLLKIS